MKITNLLRPISLLFLFFLFSLCAFAQSISIRGIVKDAIGETLTGVNVIEVGTTNGTITDMNGKYEIKVSEKSKLSFSFLGYQTNVVAVSK
ncbi:MAG TPA: carboxypeptidase-like regulatory domain-containing protein [Paludibacter sp.]